MVNSVNHLFVCWKKSGLLITHVVMRVEQSIRALFHGDVVDGVGVFTEVLETRIVSNEIVQNHRLHTVSLNRRPSPNAKGHMRSIRKVTRKKLIFSLSTKMSTVLYFKMDERQTKRRRDKVLC